LLFGMCSSKSVVMAWRDCSERDTPFELGRGSRLVVRLDLAGGGFSYGLD
jgi:hypothetical protein